MNPIFQSLLSSINVLFTGMVFVMIVLWLLYMACVLVGKFFIKAALAKEHAEAHEAEAKQSQPAVANTQEEQEVTLVIAATVDRLLEGQAFKIISIKPLGRSSWVEQGRAEIFNSKNIL